MSELIRYEWPENLVESIFDDVFETDFFTRMDRDLSGTMWPRIDIVEDEDSFVLKADLPGLDKDDITITMEDRMLTIRGEKKDTKTQTKKGNYCHLERSYGSFRRSFSIPQHVDEKNVEAHFKNGVLELHLKKTGESGMKSVPIKVD